MKLLKVKMVTKYKTVPCGTQEREIKDGKKPIYVVELNEKEYIKVRNEENGIQN